MQVLNVGSLNLNDSRVLEISIRAGEVCFCVDYIEDYDDFKSRPCRLVFKGCRSVKCTSNLDVDWPDSILCATETHDGEWRNIVLEMNTSASIYRISCREVNLIPADLTNLGCTSAR